MLSQPSRRQNTSEQDWGRRASTKDILAKVTRSLSALNKLQTVRWTPRALQHTEDTIHRLQGRRPKAGHLRGAGRWVEAGLLAGALAGAVIA